MNHLWKAPSGLYYYRYTVPQRFKGYLNGLGTIKRSLDTYTPTAATLKAQSLHFQVLRLLGTIADMAKTRPPRTLGELVRQTVNPLKVELPNGVAIDFDLSNALEYQEYKFILGDSARVKKSSIPAITQPVANVGKSFQVVAKEYLIHAKGKNLDPRTIKKYAASIARFEEWLGTETPLQAITAARWHEFKTYLLNGDPEKGRKPITAKTVDQYTNAVSEVFKMAKTACYTIENPLAGQNIVNRRGREKSPVEKFTDYELKTIFDPQRLNNIDDPADIWGTLIALHTGARLNEIFQLTVNDLKTVNGVDCVEIHEAGGNNLKTSAAARLVPLHPRLRALGLFNYIEAVKALPNSNGRLFPWLNKYEQGYGDVPSQRFTALLKEEGFWKFRRKVFNSFRHTVQTTLQTAGIDGVIRKHFIGHEVEDITVNVYGEETPLKILADACLPALAFPCIDWQGIKLDQPAIEDELKRLWKLKKKPI